MIRLEKGPERKKISYKNAKYVSCLVVFNPINISLEQNMLFVSRLAFILY